VRGLYLVPKIGQALCFGRVFEMTLNKLIGAGGALVLAFGAYSCSPKASDTAKAPAQTGSTATGATSSVTASAGSALPDCATLERLDPAVGPSVTTTCTIKLTGLDEGSSFKVELISGKVAEQGQPGEDSMVRVTKMVGADPGISIEESGVTLLVAPEYKDINGDGESDILIARDVGNVNATYAVWMGDPEGAPYVRAGEVSGEFEAPTKDGLLPVSGRSSADSTGFSFYKYGDQKLTLVGSVSVTATASSPDGTVTATSCVLEDTSGLASAGLNAAAAKAKFCGEPSVVNAYK
jgi:hypothetical protein